MTADTLSQPEAPTEGQATPEATPQKQPVTPAAPEAKPQDGQQKKSLLGQEPAKTPAKDPAAAPEQKQEGDDAGKPQGAPEKYELKRPDGEQLDGDTLKAVESVARKLNLTNEAAQAYVDHEVERVNAQWSEWQETIRQDKELGGDNLKQSLAYAKKASQLGTPGFQKLLEGPWGDHPEVFRTLVAMGRAISPDTQAGAGGDGTGKKAGSKTREQELRDRYPEDFAPQTR